MNMTRPRIANTCPRCDKLPSARRTAQTTPGTELWCATCRRQYTSACCRAKRRIDPRVFANQAKTRLPLAECGYCERLTVGRDQDGAPACRLMFGCNKPSKDATRVHPVRA